MLQSSYNNVQYYRLGLNSWMNFERIYKTLPWESWNQCDVILHPFPFSFSIFCAFYVDTADQAISHCGDFVTAVKGKRDEKQLWTISWRKSSEAQEGRRICSEWQSSTPRPRHINETVTLLKFVSNEPNEKSTAKFTKRTSLKWSRLAPTWS